MKDVTEDAWISHMGEWMRLRQDRRVEVYGPGGRRVLKLQELLPSAQILLQEKEKEKRARKQ